MVNLIVKKLIQQRTGSKSDLALGGCHALTTKQHFPSRWRECEARDTDQDSPIQLTPREGENVGDLVALYAALEHEAITALAYRYWQERGCPDGSSPSWPSVYLTDFAERREDSPALEAARGR